MGRSFMKRQAVFIKRGEKFPFVHDLDRLLRLLEKNGLKIPRYVNDAKELLSTRHLTRYPGLAAPSRCGSIAVRYASQRRSFAGLSGTSSAPDSSRSCRYPWTSSARPSRKRNTNSPSCSASCRLWVTCNTVAAARFGSSRSSGISRSASPRPASSTAHPGAKSADGSPCPAQRDRCVSPPDKAIGRRSSKCVTPSQSASSATAAF